MGFLVCFQDISPVSIPSSRLTWSLESIAQARKHEIKRVTTLLYNIMERLFKRPVCRGMPSHSCVSCGNLTSFLRPLPSLGMPGRPQLRPLQTSSADTQWCAVCNSNQRMRQSFCLPQNLCGYLIFGYVSKLLANIGLKEVALMNAPNPAYRGSINDLLKSIDTLAISLTSEHRGCNPLPDMVFKVRHLLDNTASPVTDVFLQRLENQAKKISM